MAACPPSESKGRKGLHERKSSGRRELFHSGPVILEYITPSLPKCNIREAHTAKNFRGQRHLNKDRKLHLLETVQNVESKFIRFDRHRMGPYSSSTSRRWSRCWLIGGNGWYSSLERSSVQDSRPTDYHVSRLTASKVPQSMTSALYCSSANAALASTKSPLAGSLSTQYPFPAVRKLTITPYNFCNILLNSTTTTLL